jgi:hypothetical protein
VGDTGPGGGKVFYVAPTTFASPGSACGTACKYLEAAPIGWITAATPAGQTNCKVAGTSTADPKCDWSGNTTTRIGTTSNAIGAGYANTSAIIAQSNVAGRAATVARAFQGGGKTDWSLPSKDELTLVYQQSSALGGFGYNYYWSSSELDASKAWFQGFDGYGDNGLKQQQSQPFSVRPVRAFSDSATVAAPVTTSTSTTTTTTTIAKTTTTTSTCATGGACVVGDTGPGGGKVFYVAPTTFTSTGSECGTACKYLEAAPIGWITAAKPAGQTNCEVPGTSTADPKCAWSGNTSTRIIGGAGNALGAGYANTSAIIAQSNVAGRAATVARAFQGGGKTDWYLPSKDELDIMSLERSTIGGFAPGFYWSSSEFSASNAWISVGGPYGGLDKGGSNYVRPVRAFSEPTASLTCKTGAACVVGDTGPGGGKVFYVAPTSFASPGSACGAACKYLEAAPAGWVIQTNCATSGTADPQCVWSRNETRIGTTSAAIGAGYANTSAIIARSNDAGGAASVARAFQGGGKTDWSLPSKDELRQMYLKGSAIGGFASGVYWSSSESDEGFAWYHWFNFIGLPGYGNTTNKLYVRPVRAF